MAPSGAISPILASSWAKNVLLVALGIISIFFFSARFWAAPQGTDFPDFYCAARMLIEGRGHQLYNADVQRAFQGTCAGRVSTLYIHPPFETLVYATVAWLPLKKAYTLWCVISLVFLGITMRAFVREAMLPWDWRILFASSLTFVPLLLSFLQGQDSVLLLMLVTFAFAALRSGQSFAAGCWLGMGLFKFQLILPMALALTIKRGRKGFIGGFSLTALALVGLSTYLSGLSVFSDYPGLLFHLREQPFAGVAPRIMANFRGLVYIFLHRDRSIVAITAIASLSIAAFAVFLWSEHEESLISQSDDPQSPDHSDFAFAAAALFALLVSYYVNPHDLSLLLLPLAFLSHDALANSGGNTRWLVLALLAVLFLPPLHLITLQEHAYALVSIPMIALFAASAYRLRTSIARVS
jgi:hypothetical protein